MGSRYTSEKGYLQVGDIFELEEGMEFYMADPTNNFNERGFWDKKGHHQEDKFERAKKTYYGMYMVTEAKLTGGSRADNYPDGWRVTAVRVPKSALKSGNTIIPNKVMKYVRFYQSGCFTAFNDRGSIKPIENMSARSAFIIF